MAQIKIQNKKAKNLRKKIVGREETYQDLKKSKEKEKSSNLYMHVEDMNSVQKPENVQKRYLSQQK